MSEAGGWLEISTTGFASFNSSRRPGHLVKELVQNSFDAIGDGQGRVHLDYRMDGDGFLIECRDTGEGIADLSAIRVVYLTFKKDSHLKRGRFGRGFKEVLSVARWAAVASGVNELHFTTEDGRQVTRSKVSPAPIAGTVVRMALPYGAETIDEFDRYFGNFLVPPTIELFLNGQRVHSRAAKHTIEPMLTTEVYHGESQSWRKPKRRATVELVAAREGEEATIYEMGIPVASAEWSVPFHVNVLQRVPMNPNRDALATGYARSVHAAALPILLPDLDATAATADWVGAAGLACDDSVQKQIVQKAFGDQAVRAVPVVGKRDFNDDAERVGAAIVHTGQMSAGFREMAKSHLPTAKQRVDEAQAQMLATVAKAGFSLDALGTEADAKKAWIAKRGGPARVDRCLSFAVWFCQRLVDHCDGLQPRVQGAVAIGSQAVYNGVGFSQFLAHWGSDNKLTLALDCECYWVEPLGAAALSIYVHEAAHAQNQHHGKGFHDEIERLAGVGAAVLFGHAAEIHARWPDLVAKAAAAVTEIGRTATPGPAIAAQAETPPTKRWWPFGSRDGAESAATPQPVQTNTAEAGPKPLR